MAVAGGVGMTSYRSAIVADAVELDHIFDVSFSDTFAHLYSAEDLESFRSSFGIADWERELEDPQYAFRIAEVDGVPVGYLKLAPLKLEVVPRAPALLVDQLYVLKGYHGTGVAHALMDWALEEAHSRGAEELYLTVFIDNHRARRFYDRYGFEAVGRYCFMVGNHADEDVIMRKALL
ncbi:MAG TPA: GNAT family N-acetyltransferase [Sphingomicrobium sp.]|jgi:GNAT superfamily N-acetyltransferase|nr:GNAT family N-acetyltransferase [Sphingomicrobium sp.]